MSKLAPAACAAAEQTNLAFGRPSNRIARFALAPLELASSAPAHRGSKPAKRFREPQKLQETLPPNPRTHESQAEARDPFTRRRQPDQESLRRQETSGPARGQACESGQPPRKAAPAAAAARDTAASEARSPAPEEGGCRYAKKSPAVPPRSGAAPTPAPGTAKEAHKEGPTHAAPAAEKRPLGLERRAPVMPEDRQSQLKLLIARGKEQGYLTYAQVNDHLPSRDRRSGADRGHRQHHQRHGHSGVREGTGYRVVARRASPPRPPTRRRSRKPPPRCAALDAELGRTTDPVRMYMREMGTVELLTREGEIRIAKRIEEGLDAVRRALAHVSGRPMTSC